MSLPLQISQVLKSLSPANPQELSLLRFVIACAEQLRTAGPVDLAFTKMQAIQDIRVEGTEVDARSVLKELPEDLKRYFHGLMEALDIYQGIHGTSMAVQNLSLTDSSVRELKQIRDMCLEDGLPSIY